MNLQSYAQDIPGTVLLALKEVQKEHPSYDRGAENWWRDVIRRTAVSAGANETGTAFELVHIHI